MPSVRKSIITPLTEFVAAVGISSIIKTVVTSVGDPFNFDMDPEPAPNPRKSRKYQLFFFLLFFLFKIYISPKIICFVINGINIYVR